MRPDWPLVGREAELTSIARARHEDAGGVVLVGPAGVGKTRLAHDAMSRAAQAGALTMWCRATTSMRTIPLGAVVDLLPEAAGDRNRHELLRAAIDGLGHRAAGRPVVVAIDDAHLLDDGSAALVSLVVLKGAAFVIVTIRAGEPLPDAIAVLTKDALARRIEVAPLHRDDTDELLEAALGGPADGLTKEEMWRRSEGLPLILRELVLGGLDDGSFRRANGLWRWRPSPGAVGRLAELVESRLTALSRDELTTLELVAYGEPLPLDLLEGLADPGLVEELERRGLVAIERNGGHRTWRLAHPAHGEVLRSRMPSTRVTVVSARLADALEHRPTRRRDELLRIVLWRLESDGEPPPALLVEAAHEAVSVSDIPLAERLAREATVRGGGRDADVVLAEALDLQGRYDEARAVLGQPALDAAAPFDVGEAVARAKNLYWGHGRLGEANDVLAAAASESHLQEEPAGAAAMRAMLALYAGRPADAVAPARAVLARDDGGVDGQARLWALATAVPALALVGSYRTAIGLAESGLVDTVDARRAMPRSDAQVRWSHCFALLVAGELGNAERQAEIGYAEARSARMGPLLGGWAAIRGYVARGGGRLADAERWLREAVALLAEEDPYQAVRVCLFELAGVLALCDPDAAAAALADAESRPAGTNQLFDPWIELDRAWVAAATGAVEAARCHALAAADLARDGQQVPIEAAALHDAARLGAGPEVLDRLVETAARADGGLEPARGQYARALAARDAELLAEAGLAFERSGALLVAADAAAQAAVLELQAGRRARASVSSSRAHDLAARCDQPRTPALAALEVHAIAGLTPRQLEVAILAARGVTSRTIADELHLSVRTVENHLAQVYAKLAVRGRSELAAVVDTRPSAPSVRGGRSGGDRR